MLEHLGDKLEKKILIEKWGGYVSVDEISVVLSSFTSNWHMLESSEKRDPQLGKCLYKIQL